MIVMALVALYCFVQMIRERNHNPETAIFYGIIASITMVVTVAMMVSKNPALI
jgi:hypothetical protein